MTEGKDAIIACDGAFLRGPARAFAGETPRRRRRSTRAGSVTFDSPPVASPGFDATTAYIPLKGGQLVAVNLDRGTIRWRLDVATALTPATGEGLVFTVERSDDRGARRADRRHRAGATPLPGGAAVPLFCDTGWLLASTHVRRSRGVARVRRHAGVAAPAGRAAVRPAGARARSPVSPARRQPARVGAARRPARPCGSARLPARVTALLGARRSAGGRHRRKARDERRACRAAASAGDGRWAATSPALPAADDKRIYFAARDNLLRAVDRGSGNLRWKANLPSRPAGGPLRLPDALLMPLVSSEIVGFDPETGKPAVTVRAAGEIGVQPFFRPGVRRTAPLLITVSREGQLQGFGRRFEPPPQALPIPFPARRRCPDPTLTTEGTENYGESSDPCRLAALASESVLRVLRVLRQVHVHVNAVGHANARWLQREMHPQIGGDAGQADELKHHAAHQPREHLQRQRRQADERHERDQAERGGGENRRAPSPSASATGSPRAPAPSAFGAPAQQPRHVRHRLEHAAVLRRHHDLHQQVEEVHERDHDDHRERREGRRSADRRAIGDIGGPNRNAR